MTLPEEKKIKTPLMPDRVMIDLSNEQKDIVLRKDLDAQLQKIVATVLSIERPDASFDEVYVGMAFLSETEIGQLHGIYFDDPSPTDCISFPCDLEEEEEGLPFVLGDMAVCPKIAIEYAAEHDSDPYTELTLYVVHCLLHLLGYDDIEEEPEKMMRAAEKRSMAVLHEKKMILQ